jgi:hypothetical protein
MCRKILGGSMAVVLMLVATPRASAGDAELTGTVISVDAVANSLVVRDVLTGEAVTFEVDAGTHITIVGAGKSPLADLLADQTVVVDYDSDTFIADKIHGAKR